MSSEHTPVPSGKNPDGDLILMTIMQRFSTEEAARDYFERLRWPNGPVCLHCGNAEAGRVYKVTANPGKKIRAGLYKCAECEQGFTVTVGRRVTDGARFVNGIKMMEGKRLMLRKPLKAKQAKPVNETDA